jgi:hypothetical protein
MASTVTRTALDPFAAEIAGRITQLAKADPRLRERLMNVRSRVVTVDFPEGAPETALGEVGFYDYDNDVLVVAVVDRFAGEVVELKERKASPPVTLEELAEVLELLTTPSDLRAALPRRTHEFLRVHANGLRI